MAHWILTILAATASIASAQRYGPHVSLGPTQNEILSMETVYTPGKMSDTPDDLLFLWPGISDAAKGGGDLIQTVIEMTKRMERCRPPKGYWCITPYVQILLGFTSSFPFWLFCVSCLLSGHGGLFLIFPKWDLY
jgi:hypothetical protein